jgi:hypothetical protein
MSGRVLDSLRMDNIEFMENRRGMKRHQIYFRIFLENVVEV